jgi:hypothetical protein
MFGNWCNKISKHLSKIKDDKTFDRENDAIFCIAANNYRNVEFMYGRGISLLALLVKVIFTNKQFEQIVRDALEVVDNMRKDGITSLNDLPDPTESKADEEGK